LTRASIFHVMPGHSRSKNGVATLAYGAGHPRLWHGNRERAKLQPQAADHERQTAQDRSGRRNGDRA